MNAAFKEKRCFQSGTGTYRGQGHTEDIEAIPEERLMLDMELPVFLLKPRLASQVLSLSVW